MRHLDEKVLGNVKTMIGEVITIARYSEREFL